MQQQHPTPRQAQAHTLKPDRLCPYQQWPHRCCAAQAARCPGAAHLAMRAVRAHQEVVGHLLWSAAGARREGGHALF